MLSSVLEAKDRLVAFELGAGWGPRLVTAAVAARRRGIRDIQLVGVEGSAEHVAFHASALIRSLSRVRVAARNGGPLCFPNH